MTITVSGYLAELRTRFAIYRDAYFPDRSDWFEPRAHGDAVVFKREHRDCNLLIPPCGVAENQRIVGKIPRSKRHKHFGSMQSSQALAQSVFGTIDTLGRLPLLEMVKSEDGRPAFGPSLKQSQLEFEKEMTTLGEGTRGATSVDIWFGGTYRVAVECKLGEAEFGTCSRTRLKREDKKFETEFCNGSYTKQRGRAQRCTLTELDISYWKYAESAFGWPANRDHQHCPLKDTYQIARNVLAACATSDDQFDGRNGHALIIYDLRNPAMSNGGQCELQWRLAHDAIQTPGTLRRLSWQSLIAQWPTDEILDWLRARLKDKYGLYPELAGT
jgi:hypothetical protein